MTVPNLLAERYASDAMRAVWSPRAKVRRERELWVTVLECQIELGLAVPEGAPAAYRAVIDDIDLASIERRERRLQHDVMARLEEFCALAGCEYLHWGLTSRDVTENVEQTQIRDSLRLVLTKAVAAVDLLARRAGELAAAPVVGRTHNVAAQTTTFGRRFAAAAEELLESIRRLEALIADYPLRGLKGAVGTQADLLRLFGGDPTKVDALESALARQLGFARKLRAVGQVYPRSWDFEVVSCLLGIAAGPASLATTIRLMAGHDLVSEGFGAGRVGSSAMPHKSNARSCERIAGLATVLRGHLAMVADLAGVQWNEGDVSCSVVRRVALPDAFFTIDGLLETFLTVMAELKAFPALAAEELRSRAPLLASSALLLAASASGADRSEAHRVLMRHSADALAAQRSGRPYDLLAALGNDEDFPLTREGVDAVVAEAGEPGRAESQVAALIEAATELAYRYPHSKTVVPAPLL
ncbi:MAG: adenylosuccinate lyase [bacterium]|nr:adenylosuccinate lyase [bacterium]MDE0668870.1 adenylosuccinate lyase [bacterium]